MQAILRILSPVAAPAKTRHFIPGPFLVRVVALLAGALPLNMVSAASISAPNVGGGAQNLSVNSLGATTALTIGFGNHVLGPADSSLPLERWARPIVQFPNSSFASIVGLPMVSATLHYNIVSDFLEPGDTGVSEVRIFTIDGTELDLPNRDLFAGLSGDGGAHTPIRSAS